MKLVEALEILRTPAPQDTAPLQVALVCGFTPLHLETFLQAELRLREPARPIEISTGVYDDVLGSLERAASSAAEAIAVVIEWADIDARLGLRRLGGWKAEDLPDILGESELYLARLEQGLKAAADERPIVCCLPTLPLPPLFRQRPERSGPEELRLRERLASTVASLAAHERIRVLSGEALDGLSPAHSRRDIHAELLTGAPYTRDHASAVAHLLAALIAVPQPKKGLITDLDGTLWSGILGEVGVENVSWELDAGAQRHAIYQQLLNSLASSGVLVAVASKNDESLVARALERDDLVLERDLAFPVHADWRAKSSSVAKVLAAWNIGPEAVVFVDNDPLEIAQVQDVFPEVEGVVFPASDGELDSFLRQLRGLFGRESDSAEDRLRVASVRSGQEFLQSAADSTVSSDEFLARVEGTVTFSSDGEHEQRAFELINKTNQFNINGARLTEAGFAAALRDGETKLVTVGYEDRYGPLGTIAALLVRAEDGALKVEHWVMSCRAFSRRIEHQTLEYLFDRFAAEELVVSYRATERNSPVREFLTALLGEAPPGQAVHLTRERFDQRAPARVHRIVEAVR